MMPEKPTLNSVPWLTTAVRVTPRSQIVLPQEICDSVPWLRRAARDGAKCFAKITGEPLRVQLLPSRPKPAWLKSFQETNASPEEADKLCMLLPIGDDATEVSIQKSARRMALPDVARAIGVLPTFEQGSANGTQEVIHVICRVFGEIVELWSAESYRQALIKRQRLSDSEAENLVASIQERKSQ